jgi:hypothetical protein
MYCAKCRTEVFGGSICHLCGGRLVHGEEAHEAPTPKGGVEIVTRKKHRVSKEFGQTVAGRIGRLVIEIAIFCTAFVLVSIVVVHVANWLAREMALEPQKGVKTIELNDPWMKYFWYIGCGVIVFLTVKLRFKPGK